MQNDTARARMLACLSDDAFQERLEQARRFEAIEGGGLRKKIERSFISPRIYIPYLLYAKTGLSRLFSTPVTLFWGRTVRIPLQDYDALILYMYGGLRGNELKFTKFLIQNLQPEDVFYDIGANYGFYTFLAADLCKEVHTFEPIERLAGALRENFLNDRRVVVNPIALGDTDGEISFYAAASTMVGTIQTAVAEHLSSDARNAVRKITVPAMTLDTYLQTHAKPTIMKIDVEGAEELVLKGGKKFFASNVPVIAMEIWGKENEWELSMRAVEVLRGLGYRSFRLDDEGNTHEVAGDLSVGVEPRGGENFIFKK